MIVIPLNEHNRTDILTLMGILMGPDPLLHVRLWKRKLINPIGVLCSTLNHSMTIQMSE